MSAAPILKKKPPWRHVAVTGAAQGLGRALSDICAGAGISVSMIDNNVALLEDAQAVLHDAGGDVTAYPCDLRDGAAVRETMRRLCALRGTPDVLICCAAVGDSEWKRSFSAERLQGVLDVNVMGIAHCMEHALPAMHSSGGGALVLVSSLLDARGYAGTAAYSVSKAALRSMADSARVLLRSSGIRIVLVRPGFMRTAMTAANNIRMPGMVDAEDAAQRILDGVARGRTVITFPRWLAFLAELARLFPRPLFDAIARMGMRQDGEGEDLQYRPSPAREVCHENS
jgi:NAD(P)-dependent dehydrogenase (short-subunit alcohol dehydrogenase family)